MLYDLDDEEWNELSFEHAQLFLEEMNDSNTISSEQETTPILAGTSSSQLKELQYNNFEIGPHTTKIFKNNNLKINNYIYFYKYYIFYNNLYYAWKSFFYFHLTFVSYAREHH